MFLFQLNNNSYINLDKVIRLYVGHLSQHFVVLEDNTRLDITTSEYAGIIRAMTA